MRTSKPAAPRIVDETEWRAAMDEQLAREKAHTRAQDALAAARRRLPMVRVEKGYRFDTPDGRRSLLELFDGRQQLIVYHFMFGPDWEAGCPGCSWVTDAMSHPAHLHARDVSMVLISRAPLDRLLAYRQRMGWSMPWVSSLNSDFNQDMGATTEDGEQHGLTVFLRDGDQVYKTYNSWARGVEALGSHWSYLDLTPYGRQEAWEDSPEGWPQGPAYSWLRRHDEY